MEQLAQLHQYGDIALFVLRVAVASVFVVHGMWKIENGKQMASNLGMSGSGWFFVALGVAEFFGSLALLSGFLTQIAAIGLGVIMLGAIYFKGFKWGVKFTAHDKTGWEFDLVILAACIAILILGAGKIALDNTIFGLY
ncbi:MAG: DoxX family protein [Candidatus Peregrinibacteria bacterium]|nr:DoxX family protein [Candidatus Peregrinibacteria bacterium]